MQDTALKTALKEAHAAWQPRTGHPMRTCSHFWHDAFVRHFGEPPESNDDARWDPFFKAGFPALRELMTTGGAS